MVPITLLTNLPFVQVIVTFAEGAGILPAVEVEGAGTLPAVEVEGLEADSTLMTGISSLGHLLTVQSLTPSVCRVDSNALVSLSRGTFNRIMVTELASGTCSLKFDFVGTDDRAPATLTWNAAATLTR